MEMFSLDAQLAVEASFNFKDYTRNDYLMEFLITDKQEQTPQSFLIILRSTSSRVE
jgi:hypothetical protein